MTKHMGVIGEGLSGGSFSLNAVLIIVGLFAGMLLCLTIGQRLGRRRPAEATDAARSRLSAIEAAIFGLMGLMIAFTYAGAAERYEIRRQLVVEEANAIGTAYLRLDLLPAYRQEALREKYRLYAQARFAVFRAPSEDKRSSAQAAAVQLQREIWAGTIAALVEATPQATNVVIPALNAMIEVTIKRGIIALTHTPGMILAMLLMLGLVCSLLAGYVLAGSPRHHVGLHLLAFALVMTATIYMVFDLDYPRFGLIRLDFADQALLDVLDGMK